MKMFLLILFLQVFLPLRAQSLEEKVLIDRYLNGSPTLEKLSEIENILRRNNKLEHIPLFHPLKGLGRISSGYGMRNHPITKKKIFHSGVDLAVDVGTGVYAAASGTVIFAGRKGGYGRCIIISHKYGYETIYAHLIAYYTKEGNIVRQGDIIGFVGSTGRSTGNHLHYGVKNKGKSVRPYLNISLWNKK